MENIDNFLNEKRRSMKRRSSIATGEVLKLMNMSGLQDRTLSESELLERVVLIQYNWIDSQLNELKRRAKKSSKLVTTSSTILATMGTKDAAKEEEEQQTSDAQSYEHLTDEQREFLKANEVNVETVAGLIRRLNVLLFKSELRQIEENDPKTSSLIKKLANYSTHASSSSSSSSSAFRGTSSAKDPLEILRDYFES